VGFTPLWGGGPKRGEAQKNAKTKNKKTNTFLGQAGQREEYVIRKRDIVYFTFAIASARRTSV
jgi:hypothetical protein